MSTWTNPKLVPGPFKVVTWTARQYRPVMMHRADPVMPRRTQCGVKVGLDPVYELKEDVDIVAMNKNKLCVKCFARARS